MLIRQIPLRSSRVCNGGSFHLISSISDHNFISIFVSLSISALELLKNAIAKAGYTDKIVIGMDVAASEFYKAGKYDLDFKSPDDPSRYITPDQLADLYRGFVKDYPGAFSFFFPSSSSPRVLSPTLTFLKRVQS